MSFKIYFFLARPLGCADGDLRLQDGENELTGRLEICFDQVWGTICEHKWDDADATVACRQLGFSDQGLLLDLGWEAGTGKITLRLVFLAGFNFNEYSERRMALLEGF